MKLLEDNVRVSFLLGNTDALLAAVVQQHETGN